MASTRSSSYILLSAAVLLSVLAATAAAANWCEPGLVIPLNPLPSCRTYMVRRACGVSIGPVVPLPVLKERCCSELEKIVPYCRCSALRTALDSMMTGYEMRPTCSWGGLLEFAPTLVSEAECNLRTIHGRPFCYALGAEGTTTSD
ncbi:hypothetical protein BDA96_02G079600 [Sorghum bicolor]|jgi:hypothetical protein|uniref:Bifunctional inhibitor/plant lipid transfer protein/seed storage helical domain-containing protein n=2 Tax=Sorghum bicolor TaxID=4558 RepID=A0A921RLW5_SORBI|nr:alpha-amylase inhibitor 5 [Sorghum bicolor]EER98205.1 hypothetical protein SORBI_3002G077500 [Sorghum bicolor]KAG0542164.1 hypothetical protein BDA96_02G079600 [Sorghum bicolor]|eukprot:XP_002461684.1 alpha-amylase inhibitor 5 [Sorghum bicolor]